MKNLKYKGFTLVELIISITILVILSTIAFVSFQNYTKKSRDANRLSTMKNIENGLGLNHIKNNFFILPDDYIEVYASGNLMGYEGIVGENVGRIIGLNSIPKDPKTRENYIYYTNKNRDKVQIMGFLEGEEMTYLGIEKAQAAGSGSKIPKVTGDNLGIILDSNYNRVTGSGIDILLTNSGTIYTTYFSNTDTVTSSGKDLYSKIYNRRADLLNDKSLASLDESLVGYWDMETLTGGKLKDFSKYGNNGILHGFKDLLLNGGSLEFIGDLGNFVKIPLSNSLTFTGTQNFTISILFRSLVNGDLNNGYLITQHYEGNFGSGSLFRAELYGKKSSFMISSGTGWYYSYSDGTSLSNNIVNDGKWHNFIIVVTPSNIKYYLDGILDKNLYGNYFLPISSYDIIIGGESSHIALPFKGNISDFRIYNRALSASEIQNLYHSTK